METELFADSMLRRLDALFQEVEAVDFHVSEDTQGLSLVEEEVPKISALLEQATLLLEEIQDAYGDVLPEEVLAEEPSQHGEGGAEEPSTAFIRDLVWIARSELRGRYRDLMAAAESGNHLLTATVCDDSLHRVRRVVHAMESAICELEGREAPVRQLRDLKLALQMRQLFRTLRRRIGGEAPANDEALVRRLEEVAKTFRELRHRHLYPLIRIDDRVLLRSLLESIEEWLLSDREPREGRHLFQDLAGFARLLAQVSQRQELIEHDRQLLADVWTALYEAEEAPATLPQALHLEMLALLGLDDELDLLLEALPEHTSTARLRVPLERLYRRSQRGF